MTKAYKVSLLGLISLAAAANAYADVAFHGYGQVVMGTTFSNNRTFPTESQGYSYHADPTFTPNSNFALQASAPLGDGITATTQILARGDDDFQPKFQWAYLKYDFNDTFALKAGRLQFPSYQFSDYQFVGEAYPWVVPPESVYFSQITAYDGLNLSLSKSVGDWYLYTQAIYGSFSGTVSNPLTTYPGSPIASYTVEDNNVTGLTFESTYDDWLTLRAAAFYEETTLNPLSGPTSQLNGLISFIGSQPGSTDAVKALVNCNDPTLYTTASVQVTRDKWLFIAEYQGLRNLAGATGITLPEFINEYVSLGYHFGKLLPVVTFGHRNQWLSADKIKSAVGMPFDSIIGGIAANPTERNKDYFYEATLRYDLTPTVALKLDYTFYQSHYKTSDYPELGMLTALGGGTAPQNPQSANRLLAAITFSF
jgi:hypothetical protein